jgi:hypothetical protein
MVHSWKTIIGLLCLGLLTIGCQTETPPSKTASSVQKDHDETDHHEESGREEKNDEAKEEKISTAMAKLNSEDRQLAEAQKYCAVMSRERLGAMGLPIKLDIKGEPVFVCCSGCKAKALKNPDDTLAKVAAMKASNQTK